MKKSSDPLCWPKVALGCTDADIHIGFGINPL